MAQLRGLLNCQTKHLLGSWRQRKLPRNFMMALRKASDQELGSMLAEALRAQALFRECERALALRSEDDSLRWVQAALAQLRLRIQSIRQEGSVRTLRREPVRLAHAASAATSVG